MVKVCSTCEHWDEDNEFCSRRVSEITEMECLLRNVIWAIIDQTDAINDSEDDEDEADWWKKPEEEPKP